MSKANHQILEENRKGVLSFAKEKADGVKPPLDIKARRAEAKALFDAGDLSAAIKKLDEVKDNRLGIVWHESRDLGNGTSALIRDARAVTGNEGLLKEDATEKYAMQILNQTRAAYDLIDQSNIGDKEKAKEKLAFIAKNAMDKALSPENDATLEGSGFVGLNSKTVRNYNTQMLHVLESSGITEPEMKLKFASEIASLKDNHQHIVTLTTALDANNKPHTVYEAEIMLNGLTEGQKKQYQDIAQSTAGKPCGVEWFDNMESYKQDLLRGPVARDIALGNKVIPTQLLSDIVGMRNAYQKVTAISSEGANLKILAETLHAGTPTTKIKVPEIEGVSKKDMKQINKEAKQQIADENLRQLQSFIPPGESLNLNILTSKTPFNVRGEDFVFNQLQNTKVPDVSVSASPINRWRLLGGGGRDTKQFEQNLSNVGKGISGEAGVGNVSKYLQEGNSRSDKFLKTITFGTYETTQTKAKKEIEALSKLDPDLAKDLQAATRAKSLVDSSTLFADSENINLELTAKMAQVRNSVKAETGALRSVVGEEVAKQYKHDVNFCKSGKDRTGYVQANETRELVSTHLGVDSYNKEGVLKKVFNKLTGKPPTVGEKNFLNQLAGGHTQEMAGIQGGTIGCHSIKTNPEFGLRSSDKAANGILNQQSSHFNSSIKTVKKDPEKVIEKFEADFKKPRVQAIDTNKGQGEEVTRTQSITSQVKKNVANMVAALTLAKQTPISRSTSTPPVKKAHNRQQSGGISH